MTLPIHTVGSGNVFADLGLPDPGTALAKAQVAARIADRIAAEGLTQTAAADLLGIDQPKVSALVRGRLAGFSLDRLRVLANRIGLDVTIVVTAAPASRFGRTVVQDTAEGSGTAGALGATHRD